MSIVSLEMEQSFNLLISSTFDKFSKNDSELFITIKINMVKDRYSNYGI